MLALAGVNFGKRSYPMYSQDIGVGWRLWLKWALATILAVIAGMVVFIAVGTLAGEAIDELPEYVFGILVGGIFGSTFGVAQWRILRSHLRHPAAWVWATLAGFVIGAFLIFGVMGGETPDAAIFSRLAHAVVLGSALGIAQWIVLRGNVAQSALWIPISLASWVIAEALAIALDGLIGPPLDLMMIFLAGGLVTGLGMVWLLKQSSTGTSSGAT